MSADKKDELETFDPNNDAHTTGIRSVEFYDKDGKLIPGAGWQPPGVKNKKQRLTVVFDEPINIEEMMDKSEGPENML